MQRPIMTRPAFLSQKSSPATRADLSTARDLADTLAAHADRCVGMAANMIGVATSIIVFNDEGRTVTMFNPEITEKYGQYTASEGCLSLAGEREATRFRRIVVSYQDETFAHHSETYIGWPAQIIQHEIDHCKGILI